MIPPWPASLPQVLLVSGYGRAPGDNLIRTSMDAGPAKVRRKTTSAPRPVMGQVLLTGAQLETFKLFHRDSLLDGALRFSWLDPENDDPVEMRILGAAWTASDGNLYALSLELEILP